jgi:hypothetical protein
VVGFRQTTSHRLVWLVRAREVPIAYGPSRSLIRGEI